MLMPKESRKAIYEYLLEKGVIVAKKDYTCKHPHVKDVPNLYVIKALQSMKSRGYVKEQFAWRHYYWYLTNEGIQYLRDYLHMSSQTLPETLRKVEQNKRPEASASGPASAPYGAPFGAHRTPYRGFAGRGGGGRGRGFGPSAVAAPSS